MQETYLSCTPQTSMDGPSEILLNSMTSKQRGTWYLRTWLQHKEEAVLARNLEKSSRAMAIIRFVEHQSFKTTLSKPCIKLYVWKLTKCNFWYNIYRSTKLRDGQGSNEHNKKRKSPSKFWCTIKGGKKQYLEYIRLGYSIYSTKKEK